MMSPPPQEPSEQADSGKFDSLFRLAIFGVILFWLGLRLQLIFEKSIHWDEFRFLSDVYALERGELGGITNNFHVRLFSWIPWLALNDVDAVIAGRLAMFGLSLGTAYAFFRIQKHFWDTEIAGLSLLLAVSFSSVLHAGSAFRYDPLLLFAFYFCLAALILKPEGLIARSLIGPMGAIALLVSAKFALFLPSLVSIAIWKHADWKRFLLRTALLGSLVGGALLIWHRMDAGPRFFPFPSSPLGRYSDFFLNGPSSFAIRDWKIAWMWNPFHLLIVATGLLCCVFHRVSRPKTERETYLLLQGLILVSLVIYRNSFDYFLATLWFPAAAFSAVFFSLLQRLRLFFVPFACTFFVMLAFSPSRMRADWTASTPSLQRAAAASFHRLFPERPSYLDRGGMLPSFPACSWFMSTLFFERYQAGTEAVFPPLLERCHPQFLWMNVASLDLRTGATLPSPILELRPEDRKILTENYFPLCGALAVAGKDLEFAAGEGKYLRLVAPGSYRLEGPEGLEFSDQKWLPGEVKTIFGEPLMLKSRSGGSYRFRLDIKPSGADCDALSTAVFGY